MVKLIRKTEPRQKEKGHALAHAPRRVNLSKILGDAEKAIAAAQVPEEAFGVDKQLHVLQTVMESAGLYSPDEIREVNEHRMRARWQLGTLLRNMARDKPSQEEKPCLQRRHSSRPSLSALASIDRFP